jgi:hypothetical protein
LEVVVIRLQDPAVSLADLLEVRASLRQQEVLLKSALRDVQGELRCWNQHREAEAVAGRPVARELCALWDELEGRERELAMDLVQVRAAWVTANAEIARMLKPPTTRAS